MGNHSHSHSVIPIPVPLFPFPSHFQRHSHGTRGIPVVAIPMHISNPPPRRKCFHTGWLICLSINNITQNVVGECFFRVGLRTWNSRLDSVGLSAFCMQQSP